MGTFPNQRANAGPDQSYRTLGLELGRDRPVRPRGSAGFLASTEPPVCEVGRQLRFSRSAKLTANFAGLGGEARR